MLGTSPPIIEPTSRYRKSSTRKQGEVSVARTLVAAGQIAVALGLIVGVLVYFFKRLRVHPAVRIPWRRLVCVGRCGRRGVRGEFPVWPGNSCASVELSNGHADAHFSGDVDFGFGIVRRRAFRNHGTAVWIRVVVWGTGVWGEWLPNWLGMPANYYRDAFWIAIGGSAVLIGLRHLLDFVSRGGSRCTGEFRPASVICTIRCSLESEWSAELCSGRY